MNPLRDKLVCAFEAWVMSLNLDALTEAQDAFLHTWNAVATRMQARAYMDRREAERRTA